MRHNTRMSGVNAELWHEIVWTERQELFASPERLAWIAEHYSEADVGRPGLFALSDKKLRASKGDTEEPEVEHLEQEFLVAAD